MSNIVNYLSLFGWMAVLFTSAYRLNVALLSAPNSDGHALINSIDISFEVYLLQVVQGFQLLDIVLILIGKSKGSLLGAIAQITGRLIVAWGFLSSDTDRISFFLMVFMWATADSNRYLYYVFKSELTAKLRYNLFLVMYPVGVTGEMLVINSYIRHNAETLSTQEINYIRIIQGDIIVGMIFLYVYMLNSRAKYYRDLKKQTGQGSMGEEKKIVRPKRD